MRNILAFMALFIGVNNLVVMQQVWVQLLWSQKITALCYVLFLMAYACWAAELKNRELQSFGLTGMRLFGPIYAVIVIIELARMM